MVEASGRPCLAPGIIRPSRGRHADQQPERVAVLGDDGRYHLLVDGHPICVKRVKRPRRLHRHEQRCGWWTDGSCYRIQAPSIQAGQVGRGARNVRWTVTFTETTTDPALVARRHRCPIKEAIGAWPPYQGPESRGGKLLNTLIDALGPDCHCCGRFLGAYLDHDPFTGLIHGLVCQDCNSRVDRCPHLSGCCFANYLNAPPAPADGPEVPANIGHAPCPPDTHRLHRSGPARPPEIDHASQTITPAVTAAGRLSKQGRVRPQSNRFGCGARKLESGL